MSFYCNDHGPTYDSCNECFAEVLGMLKEVISITNDAGFIKSEYSIHKDTVVIQRANIFLRRFEEKI
jgi:hypothetical protein